MIRFVVCEPLRVVYRPLPKCASTTLYRLLGEVGGVPLAEGVRDSLPKQPVDAGPGGGGTYVVFCPPDEVAAMRRRYAGYRWFAVVRDPYDRVVSNYHNKLNQYARRFAMHVYLASYVAQALAGPACWGSQVHRIRWMQRHISFACFVDALRRHGTGWDSHVRAQINHLRPDCIEFDHVIRMEHLTEGLREVFTAAAGPAAAAAAVARLGRLNSSGTGGRADPWTPALRRIAADAYRGDFEKLGYAA